MRLSNIRSGGLFSSKDGSNTQNSKNGIKQSRKNGLFINNLQNISEWIPSQKNMKNESQINSNYMLKNGMQNNPFQIKNLD